MIPPNVKKTIEKSDSSFLIEVAEKFSNAGWNTTISPYYSDVNQNVSREVDILVNRSEPVNDTFSNKLLGYVNIVLVIECKEIRNGNNAVFWFKEMGAFKEKIEKLIEGNISQHPRNFSDLNQLHYFGNNQIAFLSESSKKEDIVFKSLTQTIHSLIYFRFQNYGNFITGRNATIYFPVVIFKDKTGNAVYGIENLRSSAKPVSENFLFSVNYSYLSPKTKVPLSEFFLVDVVKESNLDSFVAALEADLKILKKMIWSLETYKLEN